MGDSVPMSHEERIKYEAARQLYLWDKLLTVGWAGLSCEESGRVGGLTSTLLRKERQRVRGVRTGV